MFDNLSIERTCRVSARTIAVQPRCNTPGHLCIEALRSGQVTWRQQHVLILKQSAVRFASLKCSTREFALLQCALQTAYGLNNTCGLPRRADILQSRRRSFQPQESRVTTPHLTSHACDAAGPGPPLWTAADLPCRTCPAGLQCAGTGRSCLAICLVHGAHPAQS